MLHILLRINKYQLNSETFVYYRHMIVLRTRRSLKNASGAVHAPLARTHTPSFSSSSSSSSCCCWCRCRCCCRSTCMHTRPMSLKKGHGSRMHACIRHTRANRAIVSSDSNNDSDSKRGNEWNGIIAGKEHCETNRVITSPLACSLARHHVARMHSHTHTHTPRIT